MSDYDHVAWIVIENHSCAQIIGAADAPYLNQLAAQHGLAPNSYAESHPGRPNYIAMTSGSTEGIGGGDSPAAHRLEVTPLAITFRSPIRRICRRASPLSLPT